MAAGELAGAAGREGAAQPRVSASEGMAPSARSGRENFMGPYGGTDSATPRKTFDAARRLTPGRGLAGLHQVLAKTQRYRIRVSTFPRARSPGRRHRHPDGGG